MVDLKVHLSGIDLDNPVIPASGTFGYGEEYAPLYDLNILGSFSFKGTTVVPRGGNRQPRIAECYQGMINSVGLENPGLKAVREKVLPSLKKFFHKPLIANISGFSIDEYVTCAKAMNEETQVGIIEVNISCPNVHGGGLAFGQDPMEAAKVTEAVKKATQKPVYMKLSPNVTDIIGIAKACQKAGADGISLINTVQAMRINLKTGSPVVAAGIGGLSGPAIFTVALKMVYQVSQAIDIPVIGIGGVSSAEDVLEMIMAGARAVQVGAANLVNPWICYEIIKQLPTIMEKYNIESLNEICGKAWK